MSLKDLFGKASEKILSNTEIENLYEEAESQGYLEQALKDNNRYLPYINFSSASNFARYGSAEKYYSDGIKNIYNNYPYDGSKKEKLEWRNNSSQIDLYIFDKIYPRTTGFVTLSGSTASSFSISGDNYVSSSNHQCIQCLGGPNNPSDKESFSEVFKVSNVYDTGSNRTSNLAIDPLRYGNSVEFWYKHNANTPDAKSIIFDIWNGKNTSDPDYLRFVMSFKDSQDGFYITYNKGGVAVNKQLIGNLSSITTTNWNHYSLTIKEDVQQQSYIIKLYVNGELNSSVSVSLGTVSSDSLDNSSLILRIGALQCSENTADEAYSGFGGLFGSIDEFRFWKEERTPKEISRNWFTQVGGGSNTDDSNTELGVYFKFNEGIVGDNQIDYKVLDYSGRVSNGIIYNYSSTVRSTGSAIDTFYGEEKESKDPIIYSSNPLVQNVLEEYSSIGKEHDENNTSSIIKSVPTWITEEAREQGAEDLDNLVQIISSYFDNLHIQIENLSKIKDINYSTDYEKPRTFLSNILTSYNFQNINLFNDTTFIEDVLSRNETIEFEEKINNIKNTIYENIYNNLIYIYKSKGTENSIRNLIRCFGVDDELIKLNTYANNVQYEIKERYNYTSHLKTFLDFNDPDRNIGVVYQKQDISDTNSKSFITGSSTGLFNYIPITLQTEVIFPKMIKLNDPNYTPPEYTEVSLFGAHTANEDPNDLTYSNDEFNFQVYAIKRTPESPDVYFKLVSNGFGTVLNLTSSWYKDVYENEKWNFSVRIKPKDNDIDPEAAFGDYIIEFTGINSILDVVQNQFNLSAVLPSNDAKIALNKNKRIYVGAHYNDFDITNNCIKSDVKISSVRYWLDYLSDEELLNHSYDSSNSGRTFPNAPAYNKLTGDFSAISKANTLLLHWDFNNVSTTDTNGNFYVNDLSDGTESIRNDYSLGSLSKIIGFRYTGKGDNFYPNDIEVVNKEYIHAAKQINPETLASSDMIQVLDTDDVNYKKNTMPTSYYFMLEKSMYQIINDQILTWFSTVKAFNNLIGAPSERYRKNYKQLEYLKRLFFSKVNNTPDFEKFIEFYKWIDSSVSNMVSQLIPASSNIPNRVRNIIESHVLERNKYESKIPLLTKKEISSYTINYLKPTFNNQSYATILNNNSLWLKNRAERTNNINGASTGDLQTDISREQIRKVINFNNIHYSPTVYDINTKKSYKLKDFFIKSFGKTVNIDSNKIKNPIATLDKLYIQNYTSKVTFDSSTEEKYNQSITKLKNHKNYLNNYEIIQGNDRTTNKHWFAANANNLTAINTIKLSQGNPTGGVLSGSVLYENSSSLNRDTRKTIFVNKFNAPGDKNTSGKYLDPVGGEFSVYNEINNRNLLVRNRYEKLLANTMSVSDNYASVHKITKNINYLPWKNQFDNAYISHQIPRSDTQYSWITSSVELKPNFSGYYTKYDNLKIFTPDNLRIFSGSVSTTIFDSNLNSSNILKTYDITKNLTSVDTTTLGNNLNIYLNNLNGPYQHPTWKQIRNYEKKLVKNSRLNNRIIFQDIVVEQTRLLPNRRIQKYFPRKSETFTSYREPPVEYNSPMQHTVEVKGINGGNNGDAQLITSYDNMKNKLSNNNLSDRLALKVRDEPQVHDILLKLQKGVYEPKPKIKKISYTKLIYPQKNMIGLSDLRIKSNYDDYNNTSSISNCKTYWKDNSDYRVRLTNSIDIYEVSRNDYSTLAPIYMPLYANLPYPGATLYPSFKNNFGILSSSITKDSLYAIDKQINYNIEQANLSVITPEDIMTGFTILNITNTSSLYYGLDNSSAKFSNRPVGQVRNDFLGTPLILCSLSASEGIYLGGNFTAVSSSGEQFSHLALWDGSTLKNPLAGKNYFYSYTFGLSFVQKSEYAVGAVKCKSLVNGSVHSLLSSSEGLWVGGDFSYMNFSNWTGLADEAKYIIKVTNTDVQTFNGIAGSGDDRTTWNLITGENPVVHDILSASEGIYFAGRWNTLYAGWSNSPSYGLILYTGKKNYSTEGAAITATNLDNSANALSSAATASWARGIPWRACIEALYTKNNSTQAGTIFDIFSSSHGIYCFGKFNRLATYDSSSTTKDFINNAQSILVCNPVSSSNNTTNFISILSPAFNSSSFATAMGTTIGNEVPPVFKGLRAGTDVYYAGNFPNSFNKFTTSSANPISNYVSGGKNWRYLDATPSNLNPSLWIPTINDATIPFTSENAYIRTIVSASNGLYLGGAFTSSVNNAYRIARWDGANFFALSSSDGTQIGLNNNVVDMQIYGNNINVAGWYTRPEKVISYDKFLSYGKNIKGTLAGVSLGERKNNILNSIFYNYQNIALLNKNTNNIYNIKSNTTKDNYIPANSSVKCLLSTSSGMYIGGDFSSYLLRWDGSNYNIVTGLTKPVRSIISGSDKLYVIQDTDTGLYEYNGTTWTQKNTNLTNGQLTSFVSSSSGIFAIGTFTISGPKTNNQPSNAAFYDGNTWSTLTGSGRLINLNAANYISTLISGTDGLYCAYGNGVFKYVSSSAGWTELKETTSTKGLNNARTVAQLPDGTIIAAGVGTLYSPLTSSVVGNIVRWNSALGKWRQVTYSSTVGDVYKLFVHGGYLYAGGSFNRADNAYDILNYMNSITRINLGSITEGVTASYEKIGPQKTTARNGFISINDPQNDAIYDVISDDNNIYFGGHFEGTRCGPIITDNKYKYPVEAHNPDSVVIPTAKLMFNNFIPPSVGGPSTSLYYTGKSGMNIYEVSYDASGNEIKKIYNKYENIFTLNDEYIYETDIVSSKKPFFDSYEKFSSDLKPLSKKYRHAPEYLISKFMKTFIKEKNGNFNSLIKDNVYTLEGIDTGVITDDVNNSDSLNSNLLDDYNINETNFSLKISALKKLLPKKDFYPSERVTTLSKYFINSILDFSFTSSTNTQETYKYALSNGSPINAQALAILQPFFAPGILLNTIKSSIAVDFPVHFLANINYESKYLPDIYQQYGGWYIADPEDPSAYTLVGANYQGSAYINEKHNFRFPFESILDPDLYIPNEYKKDYYSLNYLDPTHYTTDILTGSEKDNLVYPSYALKTSPGSQGGLDFKDYNYKLAMHNFLAEVPNFFLKNSKLTSFKSKPEFQFKSANSGTVYFMDVILEKSNKYESYIVAPFLENLKKDINNFYNATYLTPSTDFIYGPPSRFFVPELAPLRDYGFIVQKDKYAVSPYNLYSKLIDSPAYAPYVPPYFYGKSIARIKFKPKISGLYSLTEIFSDCTVEFITEEADNLFKQRAQVLHYHNNYSRDNPTIVPEPNTWDDNDTLTNILTARLNADKKIWESPAYTQMMRITSSVNLFGISEQKEVNYSSDSLVPQNVYDSSLRNNNIWVIQTKFETPSINFINAIKNENLGLIFKGGLKDDYNQVVSGYYSYLIKGLWTTYGDPVVEGEGIQLSLAESFYNVADPKLTGSLIDMCGFAVEKKTIGILEESKKVYESVVIIPHTFIKNHDNNKNDIYAETLPEILGENEIYKQSQRGNGPYYFKIDRKVISDLLGVSFEKDSLVDYEQIKTIVNSNKVNQNNSIIKLIKNMTKFVIPPHLNWLKNKNIDPFVMYIADFECELDKEDLSDIWQGLMPKPSYQIDTEEKNISHPFDKNELFHNKKMPKDIKFKVFKAKQQANINYFKLTDDSKDDERFKFSFKNSQQSIPNYSYNWPYDFFSFVELINIEANLTVDQDKNKDKTLVQTPNVNNSLYE